MRIWPCRFSLAALVCLCFPVLSFGSQAQAIAQANLPDSPDVVAQSNSSADPQTQSKDPKTGTDVSPTVQRGQQTSRILFVIPNFRAVSADTKLPPQTVKDKFVTASQDSFDYSAFIFVAGLAGLQMATNQTPEFGQGASGYGQYYAHSFADNTIENYFVEFIVPAIAGEDTRYYTLGHGGFFKRTGYALSRVAVTRTDHGDPTWNSGEIIGAGLAAGLSNAYYPQSQRTFGRTAGSYATSLGIDAGTFVFKEFWPDINRVVFRSKNGVFRSNN